MHERPAPSSSHRGSGRDSARSAPHLNPGGWTTEARVVNTRADVVQTPLSNLRSTEGPALKPTALVLPTARSSSVEALGNFT